MSKAKDVETAAELWHTLPEGSLARRYVAKLGEAAKEGIKIGVLPEAVEAEALSDWEAVAIIEEKPGEDITLSRIAKVREKLNQASDLIVSDGHRAGGTTYRLNPQLIDK